MSDEQKSSALTPSCDEALARPHFPYQRVARRLGIDPGGAELSLRDAARARDVIADASRVFLAADDERRAGRIPSSPIALDPDSPPGGGWGRLVAGWWGGGRGCFRRTRRGGGRANHGRAGRAGGGGCTA